MINAKTENGRSVVKISGTFPELCTDAVIIIRGMYMAMQRESQSDADRFKECIVKHIEDGTVFDCSDAKVIATGNYNDMRKLMEQLKRMFNE